VLRADNINHLRYKSKLLLQRSILT